MRRPNTNFLSFRPLILLAAVLALGACGGDPEANDETTGVSEEAAGMDAAESDADAAAVESADDVEAADVTPLPDWFPEDVYLPEAYTVVGAMDVGEVQRLELRVDGSVAGVAEQARAYMQANGWGDGAGDGETMGYTIGERSAMLTINERDDGAVRVGYQFTTL